MKYFLLVTITFFISTAGYTQDCTDPLMQGFKGDTTITVKEALKLIISNLDAFDNCEPNLKLVNGQIYFFTAGGDIVLSEKLLGSFNLDMKQKLIPKLKPGVKIVFDDLMYGDEKKAAPSVTIHLIK